MHILFVTSYFEPDSGAAAVRLSRLAHILHQHGHAITVLTTLPHYPEGRIKDGYRGKAALVENRDGLRVIRAWLWATPSPKISRKLISQNTFMLTAALRGLAIPRSDVVFIEAQPIFTSLAGVFLSRIKRVPYVLNVSDLWPDHLLSVGAMTETHPIYRLARRIVDRTYRGAAAIVALSTALADTIQGHIGPNEKVKAVYNAVDLERFRPGQDAAEFRHRHGLGDDKLVSFVGTFATQYDFETMFAVAEHFKTRSDVRFVFIGSGSQSELVRRRLAQGDLPNVHWIGWLDHSDIPAAWSASRLTLWAFHNHEFYRGTNPAKVYEAMASGVPVAAAMEGLGADIIHQAGAGLTVPPGDVEGLASAVERLLDDSDLHRQCSQAGRAYAEAHYDPETVVSAYEQVLLAAISDSVR